VNDNDPETLVGGKPPPLPEAIGPYRVEGFVGSGAFGTVYRARKGDDVVALKVLAAHFASRDIRRRFALEGTIRIDHPNVVKVFGAGSTPEGDDYIVLELLEGQPLNKRIEAAPLPVAEVVSLAIDVCQGLAAAHEQGLVHRDLKPGNVFLCDDGTAKVLDFGIARWVTPADDQQLTREGAVVGTPGYLSPEQAKGQRGVDARTDLWALGVILYQALSGLSPFLRDSSVATILAVVLEEADPLADRASGLPDGLAQIVDRCLRKDPEDRWPNARDLAAALGAIDVDGRPTFVDAAPGAPATSLSGDEQRVVALLLATGVNDSKLLSDIVAEWGGELIPMVGHRAIGVFGGRQWEGDETKRAVAAALAARDAAEYFAVASGRATGAGGTVSGDAVRQVERACAARRHGVAVDAVAARSLGGVPLEEVGSGLFEIPRGADLGAAAAPEPRDDLPLLGRNAEMAQLKAAASMMQEEQRPVVAWISGPPGIGKTRLRQEIVRILGEPTGPDEPVRIMNGAGESHRREVSLHLVANAIRSAAFSAAEDDRSSMLASFCEDAVGDAVWGREAAEALGRLLGIEAGARGSQPRVSDPQLQADRVRVALGDVFVGLAGKGPMALVLDDAQWVDPESLDFLEELLERTAELPFLLVLCARSELADQHPDLFAAHDVIRIQPRGLVQARVAELSAAIAKVPLRERLVRAVTARSGGNPFFVEQIVRELSEKRLLDAELDELPIPLDVEAAVQSRLDHLPIEEKRLLQRASVMGTEFSADALLTFGVNEPVGLLRRLARRGLVSSKSRSGKGDGRYLFRNALVADVAYRMLARHTVEELHRRAAAFLRRSADIDQEDIARHHELGAETPEAARAYSRAAFAAVRRGDIQDILRCSDKALRLGAADEDQFDLYMARADALAFAGRRDEQNRAVESALAHAETAADRARALTQRVALLAQTGAHEKGISVAKDAVAAARESGDSEILAAALVRYSWASFYAGHLDDAEDQLSATDEIEGELSAETAALIASAKGLLATARGDLGARLDAYQRSIELFRENGDLRRAAQEESNLADTFNRLGAYEQAETALRGALEMTQRVGNKVAEAFALANLGYALTCQGRHEDALDTLDQADAQAEEVGQRYLGIAIRVYRARALLAAGREGDAAREAEGAADEARRAEVPTLAAAALTAAADSWLAQGDAEMALALSRRSVAIRDELGGLEEDEAVVFLSYARALRASGREEDAREIARRGQARLSDLAEKIGDPELRRRFIEDVADNRALSTFAGA